MCVCGHISRLLTKIQQQEQLKEKQLVARVTAHQLQIYMHINNISDGYYTLASITTWTIYIYTDLPQYTRGEISTSQLCLHAYTQLIHSHLPRIASDDSKCFGIAASHWFPRSESMRAHARLRISFLSRGLNSWQHEQTGY